MIFSHRYARALREGKMTVDLPGDARRKLWTWMARYDPSVRIQRDPNDNWTDNSSVLAEVESDLRAEHGWERIPGYTPDDQTSYGAALRHLIHEAAGHFILDVLEMQSEWLDNNEKEAFRKKVNEILELHDCPWRLSDGEFFKLDSNFVGARLAATAHDALAANRFAGAAQEYAKARQELGAGDVKDAILHAGKSFESVLKVLTGLSHANADKLVNELAAKGFLNDLPEPVRQGFIGQVLMALPFLRNRLAGHGQGAEVVTVPQVYGELAIQIAAAMHNFLIAKQLETKSPAPTSTPHDSSNPADEIPF